MKRNILLTSLFLIAANVFMAQCTPDPLYADSLYGVWPDTTTNFAPAVLDISYFQQLDIAVPSNASQVPGQGLPPLNIDSGAVTSVEGLPPGFTFDCNSQTEASCTYLGGSQGCAVVVGTPSEVGIYPITVSLNVYLLGFAYPVTFDGYRIVVTDGTVGLEELVAKPSLGQNAPNPFKTFTKVPFTLQRAEIVQFRVLDLLGQEVFSQAIDAENGYNEFNYTPQGLESGIYLYAIESSIGTITKRMVYDHH
jgi:hypothetical protein